MTKVKITTLNTVDHDYEHVLLTFILQCVKQICTNLKFKPQSFMIRVRCQGRTDICCSIMMSRVVRTLYFPPYPSDTKVVKVQILQEGCGRSGGGAGWDGRQSVEHQTPATKLELLPELLHRAVSSCFQKQNRALGGQFHAVYNQTLVLWRIPLTFSYSSRHLSGYCISSVELGGLEMD